VISSGFKTLAAMNRVRQRSVRVEAPQEGGLGRSRAALNASAAVLSRDASLFAPLLVTVVSLTTMTMIPPAMGDESQPPRPPCPLRVACFNVENLAAPGERTTLTRFRFEPARRRHLEHIASVIETLAPDVVVMPEVVSRKGVDAVVNLLHAKGLEDYRGYHVDGRDTFSGFDVAIVSRIVPDEVDGRPVHIFVPASTKRAAKRPRNGDATTEEPAAEVREPAAEGGDGWMRRSFSHVDDRGVTRHEEAVLQRHAVVFVTVCGRKIALLGLHLKSNPSDVGSNAQRMAETSIAREIVRREIVARGYTPIVLGDINDYDPDVPMADSNRRTRTTVLHDLKDYDDATAGDELVNAARFIPRVADRYTSHWDFNENGTADADDVFSMIDHVLVHRDLVPAITRVHICHAIDLDISDHFPVVVDFDFRKLP
jgi:endonuclease/exonuclease/phosphatase family metal-dependent hydrolase